MAVVVAFVAVDAATKSLNRRKFQPLQMLFWSKLRGLDRPLKIVDKKDKQRYIR